MMIGLCFPESVFLGKQLAAEFAAWGCEVQEIEDLNGVLPSLVVAYVRMDARLEDLAKVLEDNPKSAVYMTGEGPDLRYSQLRQYDNFGYLGYCNLGIKLREMRRFLGV
ncbi:MAG: hypothetical protein ABIG95_07045 [Candidatus Woesearchaeota archaeon]